MSLSGTQLFLGFHVDDTFSKQLATINPHLIEYFVNANGEYLTDFHFEDKRYFGKSIDSALSIEELKLLETNIQSIAHKLVEVYEFADNPLVLIPHTI